MRLLFLLTCVVAAILVYPLRGGNNICDAAKGEIVEQVPYALDIVSARHPLLVGLARSWFNGQGDVDKLAENYTRSAMENTNPGVVDCYIAYYTVLFDKDQVRQAEANWIERQLNLN